MNENFKLWFYNSIFGLFLGFFLIALFTGSVYLFFFGNDTGLTGSIIGGLIGATYSVIYNRNQKKYLKKYN